MALTLNGSTGLSGIVGSAATPALQGSDTNTGYFFGTDTLGLSTGGTQRLHLDSGGRLSNSSFLPENYGSPNVLISGTNSTITLMGNGATTGSYTGIKFRVAGTSQGDYTKAGIFAERQGGYNDLALIFALDTVADATSVAIADEKLRITSAGQLLIGRTAKPNDINKLVVTGTSPADTYDSTLYLEGSETTGAADTGGALAFGGHDNTAFRNWGNIYGMKENGTGGNTASYMSFHTRPDGGNPVERLRIDSTGHLYIKGQNHEVRWYRDDEARYGAVTYDGSNFNIKNPVNDHTRVCKSDGTELIKFHNNGDVLIADGDLVISTAGHGIDFSATSDAGGMTNELLDDYEEGTFTPAWGGAAISNVNYTAQLGIYTKIGNRVFGIFRVTSNSHTGSGGHVQVNGFPFTSANNTGAYHHFTFGHMIGFSYSGAPYGYIVSNQSYALLVATNDGSNSNIAYPSSGNIDIIASFMYQV